MSADKVIHLGKAPKAPQPSTVEGSISIASYLVSDSARTAVENAVSGFDGVEIRHVALANGSASEIATIEETVDLIILEAEDTAAASVILRELRASATSNQPQVVILLPTPSRTDAVTLLRLGASEVLSTYPTDLEITRCLLRAIETASASKGDAGVTGKVLLFAHASGGAGATTLAVNAASILQEKCGAGETVCLLDFDFQFGDADVHLDLPARSRILEIVNAPERLDARMLDDLMIEGPKGLRVLTAPETPIPLDLLTPETIEKILLTARSRYAYVVVDLPVALARWSDAAFRHADFAFLVTQLSVPNLRSSRRLIAMLEQEGVLQRPMTVIANRNGGKGQSRSIDLEKAGKALSAEIRWSVPGDYPLLIECANQGVVAAASRPRSQFAETLVAMISEIVEGKESIQKKASGFQFRFGR